MQGVQSIAIIGGGTAGWMAAAALARSFPNNACKGLKITLVESDAIGTVGVGEATIPQIKVFNQFLGLDEDSFLRATKGSIKLGIEFQNWGRFGDSYIHAFGDIGKSIGMQPFYAYWLKRRLVGLDDDLWAYSLNAQAAAKDKFDRIAQIPNTGLGGLAYAYHFDAGLYAAFLRRYAEERGVMRREGVVQQIMQDSESGLITAVTLADGSTIGADFFIDCTGFRGLLIEETLGAGYEDWTHWLPCNRALAVPSEAGPRFRPYTQSIAHAAGWQWRIPLQHRVGNGHVFAADFISEDSAADILLANLEGKPLSEPKLLRFTTGRRKHLWRANCVAIGLSSGFLEPLESTSIHLIQSAISRFINCFPTSKHAPHLRAAFNNQMQREFESVRDFIILHYHANQRVGEDFWDVVRHMQIPDSLSNRLALYREAGRIIRAPDELFAEPGWIQVLVGQNILPDAVHPMTGLVTDTDISRFSADLRAIFTRTVAGLPSHADFMTRLAAD